MSDTLGTSKITFKESEHLLPPSTDQHATSYETTENPLQETSRYNRSRIGVFRVAFISAVVTLAFLSNGFVSSYPSPSIPNLNSHRNPFHMSDNEQSWHAGIMYAGSFVGALVVPTMVDGLGRKSTLVVLPILNVAGWVTVVASTNAVMLIAARAWLGAVNTISFVAGSVYLAEIAPPAMRGLITSSCRMMFCIGMLVNSAAGARLSWNWLAVVCMMPPVLLSILMNLLPESPSWLLLQGRATEAREVQEWLCGSSTETLHSEVEPNPTVSSSANRENKPAPWSSYLRYPLLKCLFVSLGICLTAAFSGTPVVYNYAVTIFEWSEGPFDPKYQPIVLGAALVIFSGISSLVFDRFSRRTMLMMSSSVATVGWLTLGAYFFTLKKHAAFALSHMSWLPLISLLVVSVGVGACSLTAAMLVTNEMFPTNARGRACSLGELIYDLSSLLILKSFFQFDILLESFGLFWLYGSVCAAGTMFVYFCVPETRGKILD